jgi:hypothetical protein
VTNPGAHYSAPPQVQITGGGGTGAIATAALDANGGVKSITVTNGGSGYVPPPVVTFGGGGNREPATAAVVVRKRRVVGITLLDGGSGYSGAPSVTITGGRRTGIGRDATATAHTAHGQVIFVSVDESGDGYEQPIAVIIAPGGGLLNNIPIWAPAGALSSTVADMANFAAAALGQTKVAGQNVPASITAGFKIAEMPYACQRGNSILLPCEPPGTTQSGLAWSIEPAADTEVLVPAVVSKNGGVPGFSTEVDLMPDQNLAVVVFVNTRQGSAADTGEQEEGASKPADIIANNILFALFCTQISNGCGSTN